MTTLTLIAAVAANGVIGDANRLPWHLPEDLKRFKELTWGHPVIMGRKTWESLPERFRPLPGRQNVVLTRQAGYRADGATVVASLTDAITATGEGEAFIIGGAEIYALALPLAQRLQLTELGVAFNGDARFPDFDRSVWRETVRDARRTEAGSDFAFVTYDKA